MGDDAELARSVNIGVLGLAKRLPSQWCAACIRQLFPLFSPCPF